MNISRISFGAIYKTSTYSSALKLNNKICNLYDDMTVSQVVNQNDIFTFIKDLNENSPQREQYTYVIADHPFPERDLDEYYNQLTIYQAYTRRIRENNLYNSKTPLREVNVRKDLSSIPFPYTVRGMTEGQRLSYAENFKKNYQQEVKSKAINISDEEIDKYDTSYKKEPELSKRKGFLSFLFRKQ